MSTEWSPLNAPPPDHTEVLGFVKRYTHESSGYMVTCLYTTEKGFQLPYGLKGTLQAWRAMPRPPASWAREGTYVVTFPIGSEEDPLETKVYTTSAEARAFLTEEMDVSALEAESLGQWVDACTKADTYTFDLANLHITFVPSDAREIR
tara:strand:- start:3055 stop:3501 length:447 start_codon:yes stop_codon:yes gene_type:complete